MKTVIKKYKGKAPPKSHHAPPKSHAPIVTLPYGVSNDHFCFNQDSTRIQPRFNQISTKKFMNLRIVMPRSVYGTG